MNRKSLPLFFILLFVNYCNWIEFNKLDIPNIEKYPENHIQVNKDLKIVVLLVDEEGTEITDLLIPFHILSIPKKLNIIILSQNGNPVSVWKGLYLIPHQFLSICEGARLSAELPRVYLIISKKIKNYIFFQRN